MKISVEIGNSNQRKEITDELGIIGEAARHATMAFRIQEIIVPKDFDAKVTELQGTKDFRSIPGAEPVAKSIFHEKGYFLLFHPNLFTKHYDNQVRFSIYWHEFTLIVNKGRFPVLTRHKLDRYANYFMNLYQLFDQYDAARKSFEFRDAIVKNALGTELSEIARADLENSLMGNLALINNKPEYYDWIKFQQEEFKKYKNVSQFLSQIQGKISQLSFSIIFAYATMDHYEYLREKEQLISEAPMLDNNTRVFLEYFRLKYEEGSADLSDGIDIMEAFWANFGIRFVDGAQSLQCELVPLK